MADDLVVLRQPDVNNPPLVIGLTGWMDGGNVSTGTVRYLKNKLGAVEFGEIKPHDFYILNFPISTIPVAVQTEEGKTVLTSVNPMEIAAIFRPHTRIEDGVIQELSYPDNIFYASESANLLMLSGDEPHVRWGAYCDCIFKVARDLGVTQIIFVGSVAAPLPHTREPRMRASMADPRLKERLVGLDVGFSEYEGPASVITALSHQSVEYGIDMLSLVTEVPHYPFLEMTTYPKSILKAASTVDTLLDLSLDLTDLQESVVRANQKLDEAVGENESFQELVAKLETAYDQEELATDDDELLRRLMGGMELEDDYRGN